MTVSAKRAVLTIGEFQKALEELTVADRIRLRKKAQWYSGGTGLEWSDLLQEAICRSLEPKGRHCPEDVNIIVFLGNVMRSIADTERKKWARETPAANDASDFSQLNAEDSSILSPEEELIGKTSFQLLNEKIEMLFSNDPQGLAIVMGDMDGCSPAEICELEPMTDKEYATARKRVRRALQRKFPKGLAK